MTFMMRRRYRRVARPFWCHIALIILIILFQFSFSVVAQENEAGSEENVVDEPPIVFPTENGLKVFTQVNDIPKAVDHYYGSLEEEEDEPVLIVVAVYSPSCPHCASLISSLEKAAVQVSEYFHSIIKESPMPIVFAKLDATLLDAALLRQQLAITSFPTLMLVKSNDEEAVDMDWRGPNETAEDTRDTILHYWYRWNFNHDIKDEIPNSCVIECENVDDLNDFLTVHGAGAIRYLPPLLNPNLSPQEASHIEWLLNNDDNDDSLMQDPLVLFVLCHDDKEENDDLLMQYHELSRIMNAKRNVLFFQLDTCEKLPLFNKNTKIPEGSIVALILSPPPSDWSKWKDSVVKTRIMQPDQALEQFVVQMTTPIIMWYDRSSVAPIAFPTYRKIHAVLFVDVDEYDVSKTAIQLFAKSCQWSKLHQEADIVCLIVPQTERRILTTFGIDLWTPLDIQATQGIDVKPVLPTLLITDQRQEGTRRYYLDATEMVSSATRMHEFVVDFWNNQLTPFLQTASSSSTSDEEPVRTNDSGVVILTGATFRKAVLENTEKHTLLYLFAPTCGHCKRFSILWNELARLVTHLGWDSILQVAKLDVTANEIVSRYFTLDVDEVPDVYFFPRGEKPIRYDVVDEFGDGAGRLSDSLDIVEWLLDVADADDLLDQQELFQLLNEQVEENEAKEEASVPPKQEEGKEAEKVV